MYHKAFRWNVISIPKASPCLVRYRSMSAVDSDKLVVIIPVMLCLLTSTLLVRAS